MTWLAGGEEPVIVCPEHGCWIYLPLPFRQIRSCPECGRFVVYADDDPIINGLRWRRERDELRVAIEEAITEMEERGRYATASRLRRGLLKANRGDTHG